jgi:hypothetical protein
MGWEVIEYVRLVFCCRKPARYHDDGRHSY